VSHTDDMTCDDTTFWLDINTANNLRPLYNRLTCSNSRKMAKKNKLSNSAIFGNKFIVDVPCCKHWKCVH